MTTTDTILFVKETSTCHYVLHIATPRLCGEPGFKSRHDTRDEAYIRCREILSAGEFESADRSLPETTTPLRVPKRTKPVIAPPPAAAPEDKDAKQAAKKAQHDMIRKAVERLLQGGDLKAGEVLIESFGDGDEEVVIEFVEADYNPDKRTEAGGDEPSGSRVTELEDILRAVGFDVIGEKSGERGEKTRSENTHGGVQEGTVAASHEEVQSTASATQVNAAQEEEPKRSPSSAPQPRDEL